MVVECARVELTLRCSSTAPFRLEGNVDAFEFGFDVAFEIGIRVDWVVTSVLALRFGCERAGPVDAGTMPEVGIDLWFDFGSTVPRLRVAVGFVAAVEVPL